MYPNVYSGEQSPHCRKDFLKTVSLCQQSYVHPNQCSFCCQSQSQILRVNKSKSMSISCASFHLPCKLVQSWQVTLGSFTQSRRNAVRKFSSSFRTWFGAAEVLVWVFIPANEKRDLLASQVVSEIRVWNDAWLASILKSRGGIAECLSHIFSPVTSSSVCKCWELVLAVESPFYGGGRLVATGRVQQGGAAYSAFRQNSKSFCSGLFLRIPTICLLEKT